MAIANKTAAEAIAEFKKSVTCSVNAAVETLYTETGLVPSDIGLDMLNITQFGGGVGAKNYTIGQVRVRFDQ